MATQAQRLLVSRPINFFLPLGQRNKSRRLPLDHLKSFLSRAQLTLAAVNQQNVGKYRFVIGPPPIAPTYHFPDRGEIIYSGNATNAIAAVSGLERQAVDKGHQGCDCLVAAQVGNVDAFDG